MSTLKGSIESNREKILLHFSSVVRPGIENLVGWINYSDYFIAPSSTRFHLAIEGGLAEHSLNVLNILFKRVEEYNLETPIETIILSALCHDLCKCNFYTKEKRNKKENGVWKEVEVWSVRDQFPMGHGEKSVSIMQDFIRLTEEEKLTIRWHMGSFDSGVHFNFPSGYPYKEAIGKYPLVTLLNSADAEASNILED